MLTWASQRGLEVGSHVGGFPKLGVPYWGPSSKGMVLFGDYISGSRSWVKPFGLLVADC